MSRRYRIYPHPLAPFDHGQSRLLVRAEAVASYLARMVLLSLLQLWIVTTTPALIGIALILLVLAPAAAAITDVLVMTWRNPQ